MRRGNKEKRNKAQKKNKENKKKWKKMRKKKKKGDARKIGNGVKGWRLPRGAGVGEMV